MGHLDTNTYRLSCPKCGPTETQAVHQSGSGYGASWGKLKPFDRFDAVIEQKYEPKVTSATCKQCGGPAVIEVS